MGATASCWLSAPILSDKDVSEGRGCLWQAASGGDGAYFCSRSLQLLHSTDGIWLQWSVIVICCLVPLVELAEDVVVEANSSQD